MTRFAIDVVGVRIAWSPTQIAISRISMGGLRSAYNQSRSQAKDRVFTDLNSLFCSIGSAGSIDAYGNHFNAADQATRTTTVGQHDAVAASALPVSISSDILPFNLLPHILALAR
jgi:hypothetical protein